MDRAFSRAYGHRVIVRTPDMDRRKRDPKYKKGWEARIPVDDDAQLEDVLARLAKHGIQAGRPYAKLHQTVVPVYGKARVAQLMDVLGL